MGTRVKQVRLDAALYWLLRSITRILVHLVCRYRVSGREHIPDAGNLLIVSNHLSVFDPLLLGAALSRRAWFFTKAEVFHWPVLGWLCRATGQIAVQRGEGDRAALEKALTYLGEGKVLVLFPEGTVERQGHMLKAHTGAAMLALRSGATVLPVALTGSRNILQRGGGWFPRVNVQFGTPYTATLPEGMARKSGLQMITGDVMAQIAHMLPPEQRGLYL